MVPDDKKPTPAVTPIAAESMTIGNSGSVIVAPTETGSAGTQTAAPTAFVPDVVKPEFGTVAESPWPAVFAQAAPYAATLATTKVAWALTTEHAAENRRRDEADRRKDETLNALSRELADERVKTARLETERATGADPVLVIGGTFLLGLAGIVASYVPDAKWLVEALVIMAATSVGLGLWRPKGWRR